ncbi:MAG: nuclear transport factor 2 family protein [Candidatus Binatia bacterium]
MEKPTFRQAVESGDVEAMVATFAEDAVLHSPITFVPFEGREAIARLIRILAEVLEDFHYTDQLNAEDGTVGLVFRAHVGEKKVEGLDLLRFNDEGQIRDFTVMIRPRSATEALLAVVAPRLATG